MGNAILGTNFDRRLMARVVGVRGVVESALPGSPDSQPWRSYSLSNPGGSSGTESCVPSVSP